MQYISFVHIPTVFLKTMKANYRNISIMQLKTLKIMLFSATHEQMLVVDEYNRRFLYPSHGKGHDGVYFLQIGVTMVKVLPY